MKAFLIFLLIFTISSLESKKHITSIDSDYLKTLHQVLFHMMFKCRNDIYTVFIHDERGIFTIDQLSFTEKLVSIIFYNDVMINSYEEYLPSSEIDAFIMFMSLETQWEQICDTININYGSVSPWKTIAPFYVINLHENKCNAEFALTILYKIFNYNIILESYFICRKANESTTTIFTYNNYDRKAQSLWVVIPKLDNLYDDAMLFSRDYNENICTNLYFNRMGHLEDFPITVAVPLWNESVRHESLVYKKDEINMVLYPPDRMYVESLAIALKFEISYRFFNPNDSEALSKIFHDCGFKLITLQGQASHEFPCYGPLYPTDFETFSFVTRSREYKTPLERIRDYYGIWTLVSMLVLLSLTLFVIWRIKGDFSFAGFEVVRLLINSSIEVNMNNLSRKIFFTMIFLYFLIFHATFSGHLAEFLTKPQLHPSPETIDDLANDPQYTEILTTYGPFAYLKTHPIYDRLIPVRDIDECFEEIFHSKSIACIDLESNLKDKTLVKQSQIKDAPYHLSQKNFGFLYVSVFGNPYSSLTPSINKVYMKVVEAGLFKRRKQDYYPFEALKIRAAEITKPINFKILTLQSLQFGFVILGSGLIFASIIFIIELIL